MKKTKKFLTLLLTLALLAAIAAPALAAAEKPVELVMAFWCSKEPADFDLVFEKLSDVTEAKIGVRVKRFNVNMANYPQQMNLMLAGGEQVDLMCMYYQWFLSMYAQGHLMDITDLMQEYGQGIIDVVGEEFLEAGKINGSQYAVPTMRDLAKEYGFVFDEEMAERNGIDVSTIKTFDDLEAALAVIKENEPGVVPLIGTESTAAAEYLIPDVDLLSDSLGVLFGDSTEVVNLYASDAYMEMAKRMRDWYLKGYISEDVVTSAEAYRTYFKAGTAFADLSTLKPGYAFKESLTIGKEISSATIIPAITNTTTVQSIQWTIPENTEYPEKAMQLLNLMYTDPEVMNLLAWGIEGRHYQVLDNGMAAFADGVNADNSGYNLNYGWMFGNQFIAYVWNGDSPTIWQDTDEWNKSARRSPALGFTFDSTPVKNEVAACTNVVNEFSISITSGMVDPETTIPEFVKKLEASGIDKIIAEKQSQLNEWLANK